MEFKLTMECMEFRESKEFTVYKVSMDSIGYTVCMEFGAPEIGGHIDLHGKGLSWLQGRSIASLYTRRNILPQKSTRKYVHRELTRPLVGRVYITGQQAAASNRGRIMAQTLKIEDVRNVRLHGTKSDVAAYVTFSNGAGLWIKPNGLMHWSDSEPGCSITPATARTLRQLFSKIDATGLDA